ncbi:TetR/AcrR family transcriptional regulator [Metaclostridioides mangenotii]|uniref:TetR/AcrR family transcriptional regulator n=1 Tax=Metaclostridioides mangenotii TaxID=1540 RepID=UPI0004842398|nr:TetR/AcrR family transcriptional regulator [Clostridioides mangenotii]
MYKVNNNPLAIQSQHMIADAFINLLQGNDYNDITITQICNEAMLSRRTFYRNFKVKEDIIEFLVDKMTKDIYKGIDYGNVSMEKLLYTYFSYWKNNRDFIQIIYTNNLFFYLSKKFIDYAKLYIKCDTDMKSKYKYFVNVDKYVVRYIDSTLSCILELWVENDFKESVESISKLTYDLINKS